MNVCSEYDGLFTFASPYMRSMIVLIFSSSFSLYTIKVDVHNFLSFSS
jgi:hypothetical protein